MELTKSVTVCTFYSQLQTTPQISTYMLYYVPLFLIWTYQQPAGTCSPDI